MTEISALLADFERAGGTVTIEAGTVQVCYPKTHKQAVAPILSRLREHKAEVIRLLQEHPTRGVPALRTIKHEPVQARIISRDRTELSTITEECWHCGASGRCGCAVCGGMNRQGKNIPGECQSCRGTRVLAYETVQ